MPPKGEPLEPRFDRGEIAKNQTYMPPVLVSLLPMKCMKRDTIRWMNAMDVQSLDIESFGFEKIRLRR